MARDANTFASAFPQAALRPTAGTMELGVAAAAAGSGTRPERVTRLLTAAYETIAAQPVTPELVRHLSSATREWLLQRVACHFAPDLAWFETSCEHCGQTYDLNLSLMASTRRAPAEGFPVARIETSLGKRSFEAPNGAHEEAVSKRVDDEDPRRLFARLCGLSENADREAGRYDERDLDSIDAALEAVSPDVADGVTTVCPVCGSETWVRVEPLLFAFPREGDILYEIHLIAASYKWSLSEILGLAGRHRSLYAGLIARDKPRRPAA